MFLAARERTYADERKTLSPNALFFSRRERRRIAGGDSRDLRTDVRGYRPRRDDLDVGEYQARFGPTLTSEDVAKATVELVSSADPPGAYLLTSAGLSALA